MTTFCLFQSSVFEKLLCVYATVTEMRSRVFVHSQVVFMDAMGRDFEYALALSTGLWRVWQGHLARRR